MDDIREYLRLQAEQSLRVHLDQLPAPAEDTEQKDAKLIPKRTRARLEEAFLAAFENIGGVPRLTLWADENQTEFYKLTSKLFPTQLSAHVKQEKLNINFNIDVGTPPPEKEVVENKQRKGVVIEHGSTD